MKNRIKIIHCKINHHFDMKNIYVTSFLITYSKIVRLYKQGYME